MFDETSLGWTSWSCWSCLWTRWSWWSCLWTRWSWWTCLEVEWGGEWWLQWVVRESRDSAGGAGPGWRHWSAQSVWLERWASIGAPHCYSDTHHHPVTTTQVPGDTTRVLTCHQPLEPRVSWDCVSVQCEFDLFYLKLLICWGSELSDRSSFIKQDSTLQHRFSLINPSIAVKYCLL